jgi:CRP/FNR family transcriptional regulator, anaerobic regulatory protein
LTKSGRLNRELTLGQRKLRAIFEASSPQMRKAGELLLGNEICYLQTGWACQFRNLSNRRLAIVDVFLPGDMIGVDISLHTRPQEELVTLTAVTLRAITAEDALIDLMGYRPAALYIAWLLGQRQQRADRHLAAISYLDAPGRVAMMVLDFYTRLRRRKLITGSTYNLPLTQAQIGNYLGLTVVHINRVLRSLREAGIVNLEKHCVTILDLERLTDLAEDGGTVISSSAGVGRISPIGVALPASETGSITSIGIAGNY